MELTKIAARILGRWLAWLLCGALWGALCGAIIGACFAGIFWAIFMSHSYFISPNYGDSFVQTCLNASMFGLYEGAGIGAISFGLNGLSRVWRASAQTGNEIWLSCRAAWWTSIFGAAFFAGIASLLAFGLVVNKAAPYSDSIALWFFFGSQLGGIAGVTLGVIAPNWFANLRRIFEPFTPRAKRLK